MAIPKGKEQRDRCIKSGETSFPLRQAPFSQSTQGPVNTMETSKHQLLLCVKVLSLRPAPLKEKYSHVKQQAGSGELSQSR